MPFFCFKILKTGDRLAVPYLFFPYLVFSSFNKYEVFILIGCKFCTGLTLEPVQILHWSGANSALVRCGDLHLCGSII